MSIEIPSMEVPPLVDVEPAAAKPEPKPTRKGTKAAAAEPVWTTERVAAERARIAEQRAALIAEFFGGAPRGVEALEQATRDKRRDAHLAGAIAAAHTLADLDGQLGALAEAHRQAERREQQQEAATIREAAQHADAAAAVLPGLTDARRRTVRNAIRAALDSEAALLEKRAKWFIEPTWSADALRLEDESTFPREARLAIGETRGHWLRVLAAAQQHV